MKNDWLKTNIITAIVPVAIALGYGLAYTFERGYCDIFGIPPNLIELTISSVLFAVSTVVILIAFSIFLWFPYVYIPLNRLSKRWGIHLTYLAGSFLVVIMLVILYQEVWLKWLPLLLVSVVIGILSIIIPIIHKLFKNGLNWIRQRTCSSQGGNKTKKFQDEITVQTPTTSETKGITKRKLVFSIVSAIFILFAFTFFAGQASAEMQDEFFVINDPMDSVILRIYGDNLICAPIDMREFEIIGNLFIKRLDHVSEIMKLVDTGRIGSK